MQTLFNLISIQYKISVLLTISIMYSVSPTNISVIIATCNRRQRLLSLLRNLEESLFRVKEVIIADSGDEKITTADLATFKNLAVTLIYTERSVCKQRNRAIAMASSPLIFICDDDIEVPPDYLEKIVAHINNHPEAIAVSGVWRELEKGQWIAEHPIQSIGELVWKYIFKLSIWGKIDCRDNFISRRLKKYYKRTGNHITKAGWPVITDFSGSWFTTPLYSLGASVVKREWLLKFPYDEVLDSHGIGDNYGVVINFPPGSIHVLNNISVFHHLEALNRLQKPLQYFRRASALDYYIRTNKNLQHVKRTWLLWSLMGNLLAFLFTKDGKMIVAGFRTLFAVAFRKNPYLNRSLSQKSFHAGI